MPFEFINNQSSGQSSSLIWGIVISILGSVALFLLLREFYCWYFKINKIVQLLEWIEQNTRPESVNKRILEEQKQEQQKEE